MKKLFVYLGILSVAVVSCRKDNTSTTTTNYDVATQNSYDDQAIATYLTTNYLDARGNIVAYSSTDTSDDNYPNLASYKPVTLPSGVVYLIIPNAQPASGTAIGANDAISIMQNTTTYQATKDSSTGAIGLNSGATFSNNIGSTGIPSYDPAYYYVKNSYISNYNTANNTTRDHSFFEIEGLREGLSYFKAFNLADSAAYNLQGIIIVPSRAAFAQDAYYTGYSSYSLNNRTFVFNFQIYRTTPRSVAGD